MRIEVRVADDGAIGIGWGSSWHFMPVLVFHDLNAFEVFIDICEKTLHEQIAAKFKPQLDPEEVVKEALRIWGWEQE